MSQKNVMLCESSIALCLSTTRVICNEHFSAQDSSKVDALATKLILQNEESIVSKLLPVCAKLAQEDEMPGKLFALIEEILMTLVLFSQNLEGEKMKTLFQVINETVVGQLIQEKDLGNILCALNLYRIMALLNQPG